MAIKARGHMKVTLPGRGRILDGYRQLDRSVLSLFQFSVIVLIIQPAWTFPCIISQPPHRSTSCCPVTLASAFLAIPDRIQLDAQDKKAALYLTVASRLCHLCPPARFNSSVLLFPFPATAHVLLSPMRLVIHPDTRTTRAQKMNNLVQAWTTSLTTRRLLAFHIE